MKNSNSKNINPYTDADDDEEEFDEWFFDLFIHLLYVDYFIILFIFIVGLYCYETTILRII